MEDQLKPLPFDELKKLIRRGGELCDRSRETREDELYEFKQHCLLRLGAIGTQADGLYRRLTELDFKSPSRASRNARLSGRGILDPDDQVYRTLDEMLGILKSAYERVTRIQPEQSPRVSRQQEQEKGSRPDPYSKRDHKVFELIGRESFLHLGNDEIHKRNRNRLKVLLGPKTTAHAVRSILNRIRKHHRFPSSNRVKKSDQG